MQAGVIFRPYDESYEMYGNESYIEDEVAKNIISKVNAFSTRTMHPSVFMNDLVITICNCSDLEDDTRNKFRQHAFDIVDFESCFNYVSESCAGKSITPQDRINYTRLMLDSIISTLYVRLATEIPSSKLRESIDACIEKVWNSFK